MEGFYKPLTFGAATDGVLIAVLVGILLGVGGFTGYYGEGLSYFSTRPRPRTSSDERPGRDGAARGAVARVRYGRG